MPFKSDAQRKFFNANRGKLEAQGVNVDEWNQASKGMNLPEHAAHQWGHPSRQEHMHAGIKAAIASPNTPPHLKPHLKNRLKSFNPLVRKKGK